MNPQVLPDRRRPPRLRAFTTLELLVAIGLVVVLLSILFPLAGSLGHSSREVRCLANLRQIAAYMNVYLAGHQQTYPYSFYENTEGKDRLFWATSLVKAADVADYGAFICPSVKDIHPYLKQNAAAGAAYISYGINRSGLAPSIADRNTRANTANLRQPHEILMAVDCDSRNQPGDGWYSAAPSQLREEFKNHTPLSTRHRGTLNALYCDGHAAPITETALLPAAVSSAPWFGGIYNPPPSP